MSFKEVKRFRKDGELSIAMDIAKADLEANPDLIWNKRSLALVHLEYLRKYASPKYYDKFIEHLEKINEIDLPEKETMVFDSCAWQIGKMVFALQDQKDVDYNKLDLVFNCIKEFNFSKSSEAYTYLFRSFHKGYNNWSQYIKFVDWWGLENFRSRDYMTRRLNGKEEMSIVEQAYCAYAKIMVKGVENKLAWEESNSNDLSLLLLGFIKLTPIQEVAEYLEKVTQLLNKHPEYKMLQYFKAKMLAILDKKEDALSTISAVGNKFFDKYWYWELIAKVVEKRDIKFACYCKALTIDTEEKYLVKLRQDFTEFLIQRELFDGAKTEVEKVLKACKNNAWSIPDQIEQWREAEWYKGASLNKNNKDLYKYYSPTAIEFIQERLYE